MTNEEAKLWAEQTRVKALTAKVAALEVENTKLRAALEAAGEAFKEISTKRKTAIMNASLESDPKITLLILDLKTYAVEAMRACWTALGKLP